MKNLKKIKTEKLLDAQSFLTNDEMTKSDKKRFREIQQELNSRQGKNFHTAHEEE